MQQFNRSEITFAQAEGVVPLPTQLELKSISAVTRARLWEAVLFLVKREMRELMQASVLGPTWARLYKRYSISVQGKFADTLSNEFDEFVRNFKPIFSKGDYVAVFGIVEWLIRNLSNPEVNRLINSVLEEEFCAYRIKDNSIIPFSSAEEGVALINAMDGLATPEFQGARKHLVSAGSFLGQGSYADSVRESIHAV